MSKKAYIGIDNVARKIKKGYIGINGISRKIKKAYIGIGGVARPFWSGGELVYYGSADDLSLKRYNLTATHVGKYALFMAGTITAGSNISDSIEVYDYNLIKSIIYNYNTTASNFASSTHVGTYAILNVSNIVAFTESLSAIVPTQPNISKYGASCTHVGDYAIIAGGSTNSGYMGNAIESNIVDAYDKSLTRSTVVIGMIYGRWNAKATHVGDYAIIAGGDGANSSGYNFVDAYDSSLTKIESLDSLSERKEKLAATYVENHALFGGGIGNNNGSRNISDVVNGYDSSLTRSIQEPLSIARYELAATHVGDFALFAGGFNASSDPTNIVDVYDSSLTRTTSSPLLRRVSKLAATHVGDYALFGGGDNSTPQYGASGTGEVTVYTIK